MRAGYSAYKSDPVEGSSWGQSFITFADGQASESNWLVYCDDAAPENSTAFLFIGNNQIIPTWISSGPGFDLGAPAARSRRLPTPC